MDLKYIGGVGNPRAKLLVCGEAPGKQEVEKGYPFAGPSGQIVNNLLREAGMGREEVYVTNVVKVRPPDNKLHRLGELGKSVEDFTPQLWKEIEVIEPNCILAIGNLSLKVLTGNTGIKKWRGSILPSVNGYPKVVPTIHPASILHGEEGDGGAMMSWKDLTYIGLDFKRAVLESKTKDLNLPERLLTIAHSSLDLFRFLDKHKDDNLVSVDIESPTTIPLCIALAFNNYEAVSVPLRGLKTYQSHDLRQSWKALDEFLRQPNVRVIGQNFKFDQAKLLAHKLYCPDPWFDVMVAFHVLYPELPKRLQFISSILTREPYYKDEYQEFDPKKHDAKRILLYNAKDAAVTYECFEVLQAELRELGHEEFFHDIMKFHRLYLEMDNVGLKVDLERQKGLLKKYEGIVEGQQKELDELVGYEVNVNSSAKQIPFLLYHDLKIPRRQGTDEETLQSLLNNVVKDSRKRRIIELILSLRKVKKTISTYIKAETRECDLPQTKKVLIAQ